MIRFFSYNKKPKSFKDYEKVVKEYNRLLDINDPTDQDRAKIIELRELMQEWSAKNPGPDLPPSLLL